MAQSECFKTAQKQLRSWTPATTELLLGHGAFDILDHAMDDSSFCQNLRNEVTNRWLSQVKPARTQGEVQTEAILSFLPPTTTAPARGDKNIFIPREERSRDDFSTNHPHLYALIHAIETTAESQLEPDISLDRSLTSVQLAVYPGDGTSGYPRHCDRSGKCQQEVSNGKPASSSTDSKRVITAVYYLTPDDWSAELDGGCLRVFGQQNDHYYDVVPYANRLVVFRSDQVEHQVLPSLRRERMALTVWLYGHVGKKARPRRALRMRSTNKKEESPTASDSDNKGPPPLSIGAEHDDSSTIFVAIASYRDSELAPTLRSLMTTAQHPDRVHVGIVLQIDDDLDHNIVSSVESIKSESWYDDSRIVFLQMPARHARGPCYARDLCQRLYAQQDFYLQIDSHMRFRRNWDSYLIAQLPTTGKSMLTAYPVGYTLPNNIPNETRGTLLVPWKFGPDGMLRQRGRLFSLSSKENVPCHLYAAGFNFARGSVVKDCPYDGSLQHFFFGEELSMAVRLYCAGYDLLAPPETVVYHLWSRAHRPPALPLFENESRLKEKCKLQSLARVQEQLLGVGLDTKRSITDFEHSLKVDFSLKEVQANAESGFLRPEDFVGSVEFSVDDTSVDKQVASLDAKSKNIIASFLAGMN